MKSSRLEVLFSPAEFETLSTTDLSETGCVVFDILRATTSIVSALANGAKGVIPVESIEEAVEIKRMNPAVLLAGERHGLRITAEVSGGTEFDFGNSPREFTQERVSGRILAMTTTNGTRGLKACTGALEVLAACFLNLEATRNHLRKRTYKRILLVCSGTYEEASYEDTIAAGALADALWDWFSVEEIGDSAQMARNLYLSAKSDLMAAMKFARNGRRLLNMPGLAADVPYCLQQDKADLVSALVEGRVIRVA